MTARGRGARAAERPWAGLAVRLAVHQFRYDLRAFVRNRQSRFFTLVLPVLFLVIFASLFHGNTVTVPGGTISTSVYYVPGIITLGIIAAALLTAYNPHTTGAGFAWGDLLIVALWGIAGLAIALWRFSWVPLNR